MKIKLFGFLFVCVFGMTADMRAFGQCCWCEDYDGCELGADNISALDSPDCQPANCNNYDCSYCDENPENPPDDGGSTGICPGYGDCDGVPSNSLHSNPGNCRCKSFNVNCDGQSVSGWHICSATPSGERYYDIFNESGYHFEGDVCYSNERECAKFNVNVTGASGAWTCKKEYQTGTANWTSDGNGKWNVSGCECNKYDLDIPGDGCKVGVVEHVNLSTNIQNATDKINYFQGRRYCDTCYPGKVPKRGNATYQALVPIMTLSYQPEGTSQRNWGTYRCEQVLAPYYATGCKINFNKANFIEALNECQQQCDDNYYLTITANGATSADSCAPDSDIKYTDSTGEFILGPDKCNN